MPSQLWLKFDKIVCYLQILNEPARIFKPTGAWHERVLFWHQSPCCEVSLTGIGRNNSSLCPQRLSFSLTKVTQILYDIDYLACFSFRTLETSNEISNDSQIFNTIIKGWRNVFSDIVYQKMSTVEYRAIFRGLQLICIYTPAVTLETPNSKINIPVCIITCV